MKALNRLFSIRRSLFSLALVLISISGFSQWSHLPGPVGGNVVDLAVGNNVVFAGGQPTGLFKSVDGGNSWSEVPPESGLTDRFVSSLRYVNGILYVGTATTGLYYSADNGLNFSAPIQGLFGVNQINAVVQSGTDLYLASGASGIYKSGDNGQSWTPVTTGFTSLQVRDMTMFGTTIVAGTDQGILTSSDNGVTWVLRNTGLTTISIFSLGTTGGILYAGTMGGGIFRSLDGGQTWNAINAGITFSPGGTSYGFAFSGTTTYAAFDSGVWQSTNNGDSWSLVNNSNGLPPGSISTALAVVGGDIIDGTTAGIFRTTSGLNQWSASQTGFTASQVTGIAKSAGILYAAKGNLEYSVDGGTTWQEKFPNMGFASLVAQGNTVYAGVNSFWRFIYSDDNGATWTFPANTGLGNFPISSYGFLGSKIVTSTSDGIFITANRGQTWTDISAGLPSRGINSITTLGNTLFAAIGGFGIFMSTDEGLSWTDATGNIGNKSISSIVAIGTNLFVGTFLDGVYRSSDMGVNWTRVSSGLPELNVFKLNVNGTQLFAGTASGYVVYSANNGDNWVPVAEKPPVAISTMMLDGNSIYAGTFGRSIVTAQVPAFNPLSITGVSPTSGAIGSTFTISGNNFDTVPSNNHVTFNFTPATVLAATTTTLTVVVPNVTFSGNITVAVGLQKATAPTPFTVLHLPVISSFSPSIGSPGTSVLINGSDFSTTGNISVSFNGTPALITFAGPTSLSVQVPDQATTGPITVVSNGDSFTTTTIFTVDQALRITNYVPSSGTVGTPVTIMGTNFSPIPANNIVTFNGTPATVLSSSSTTLSVVVPSGATTGPISVQTGGKTFTYSLSFQILSNPSPGARVVGRLVNNSPSPIGPVNLRDPEWAVIRGNYAYVISTLGNAFDIINISNPASPTLVGSVKDGAGGAALNFPFGVFVSGNYAYVASYGSSALEIIDISNPSAPFHAAKVVSGQNGANLGGANSVYIVGNYAYVVDFDANALEIFDISNPLAPFQVGSLADGVGGAKLNTPNTVFVSGNYAYVASFGSNALEIINVSDPAHPVHAGSLVDGLGGAKLNQAYDVFIQGNYAFVAGLGGSLEIADISNPNLPVHAGSISNGQGGAKMVSAYHVWVVGNTAYVAGQSSSTIEVIDVSNKSAPVHKYVMDGLNGTPFLSLPTWIQVVGKYAYVGTLGANSFEIIDLNLPTPSITSFAPAQAIRGASVVISGTNFDTNPLNNTVAFNGVPAEVISATSSEITVKVPAAATSGKITVTVDEITGTSSNDFTVLFPPVISTFSPASGPVGTTVLISGTNFDALPANNQLTFNGVVATITEASPTSLTAVVPPGASTGKITVVVNGLAVSSSSDFTVLIPPTITSFNPISGIVGSVVTISGTNFDLTASNNQVTFNGVSAQVISSTSTTITVQVPVGASTGPIGITINGLGALSSALFTVIPPPVISSFSPVLGPAGTTVSISGNNFDILPANNIVTLNGTAVSVTAATSTTLTILIPQGATTGKFSVTTNGLNALSPTDFTVQFPPTIASFSPGSGPAGSTVTIAGSNFSPLASGNLVTFNGVSAQVIGASATSLSVLVPDGALTGLISVTVNGLSTTSTGVFMVLFPPTITSISPATGPVGAAVTITGTNFSAVPSGNIVAFNGTNALVTASSATSITTTVPNGATSGTISVTVAGLTATSGGTFTVTTPVVGEVELEVHPNPFHEKLFVDYELPEHNQVPAVIQVFTNAGGFVISANIPAGSHEGTWVWDSQGQPLGYYLVRLTVGNKTVTKRVLKR